MPLFGPTYYCPNAECEFERPLKKGDKCPNCNAEAKPFGMVNGAALFATKRAGKKGFSERILTAKGSGRGGYFCPNPVCANVKELRQGEKCPACGTEAQSDEAQGAQPPAETGEGEGGGTPLFTRATTDEELEERIRLGVERLDGLGRAAQGGAAEVPGFGSAVYEQNNIIILQNELILRKLMKRER